jgi:hypothetical protein
MKKLAMTVLLASPTVGSGMARTQTPAAKAPSTSAELKQLEHTGPTQRKPAMLTNWVRSTRTIGPESGRRCKAYQGRIILRVTSRERVERKAWSLGRWT